MWYMKKHLYSDVFTVRYTLCFSFCLDIMVYFSQQQAHKSTNHYSLCACVCVFCVRTCEWECVFAVAAHLLDNRGVAKTFQAARTLRAGFLTVKQLSGCLECVRMKKRKRNTSYMDCIIESHRRLSWNISNLMLLISVCECVCECLHIPFVSQSDPGSTTSLVWPLLPKFPCSLVKHGKTYSYAPLPHAS